MPVAKENNNDSFKEAVLKRFATLDNEKVTTRRKMRLLLPSAAAFIKELLATLSEYAYHDFAALIPFDGDQMFGYEELAAARHLYWKPINRRYELLNRICQAVTNGKLQRQFRHVNIPKFTMLVKFTEHLFKELSGLAVHDGYDLDFTDQVLVDIAISHLVEEKYKTLEEKQVATEVYEYLFELVSRKVSTPFSNNYEFEIISKNDFPNTAVDTC